MMSSCRARKLSIGNDLPAALVPLCEYCLKYETDSRADPTVIFDASHCIRLAPQLVSRTRQQRVATAPHSVAFPSDDIGFLEIRVDEALREWIRMVPCF